MSSGMDIKKIGTACIEPVMFGAIATCAGCRQFIHYFPAMTPQGLLGTSVVVAIGSAAYDCTRDRFSFVEKAMVIATSTLVAISIAQSLKGRASVAVANTCKLSSLFSMVALIKWSLQKKVESMRIIASDGNNLSSPIIQIRSGQNKCIDYKTSSTGTASTIFLHDHVYRVYLKDQDEDMCYLLMKSEDFHSLRAICHRGAFGNDFQTVKGDALALYGLKGDPNTEYHLLWKIPADLTYIENYSVDTSKIYTNVAVGTYLMVADRLPTCKFLTSEEESIFNKNMAVLKQLQNHMGTKVRSDCVGKKSRLHATHQLVLKEEKEKIRIPGIATAFFLNDYNDPQDDELEKIANLLRYLAIHHVGAYLCNSAHHIIVIGAYKGKQLTPSLLAELLQNNKDLTDTIVALFQQYAIEKWKESVVEWKELFISHYATEQSFKKSSVLCPSM